MPDASAENSKYKFLLSIMRIYTHVSTHDGRCICQPRAKRTVYRPCILERIWTPPVPEEPKPCITLNINGFGSPRTVQTRCGRDGRYCSHRSRWSEKTPFCRWYQDYLCAAMKAGTNWPHAGVSILRPRSLLYPTQELQSAVPRKLWRISTWAWEELLIYIP